MPKDQFCFREMYINRSKNKELEDRGILSGQLNNKDYLMKVSYANEGHTEYMEGTVGDKEFSLEGDHSSKNVNYKGIYGNKEFNLNFHRTMKGIVDKRPKSLNITGTYDGKDINIEIPGANIPEDDDLKDLLTMAIDRQCYILDTYKGKIVGLYENDKIYEYREEQRNKRKENIEGFTKDTIGQISSIVLTSIMTALLCKFGLEKKIMGKSFKA